jgi:hypothetical protein
MITKGSLDGLVILANRYHCMHREGNVPESHYGQKEHRCPQLGIKEYTAQVNSKRCGGRDRLCQRI